MNKQRPIAIAGAGPSGLAAAINLSLEGYAVDVYEKRSDTGKRFHGDLQGLENWSKEENVIRELARMNVHVNFDCAPFRHLVITNGENVRRSEYPEDEPLCYLVKRGAFPGSLDHGLKAQALEAGVRIHFKETIPLEEADIVATGPISREIFAVDKGIVFDTDCRDLNVFLVNDEAAYKGYSYLLITNGYGCLCTCIFDNFDRLDDFYETSRRMLEEEFDFNVENPRQVAGVGSFSTRNVFQENGRLFVGEAAGIQDLMWGFGIRTAVESGWLAARCIVEGRDYETAARAHFADRLKATLVSRFVWELARVKNYALVVNERAQSASRSAFDLTKLYNFGPVQRLLYPLALPFVKRRYPNLRL